LSITKLAVAVLSTGSICFPLNRPIMAFYHSKNQDGKQTVLGSHHMFSDQYLHKEENSKIMDVKGDKNPCGFITVFDLSIYQLDTICIPKVIKIHKKLN
ncbi:hypothetical protein A6R68_17912, partial [Neotoma lepida]